MNLYLLKRTSDGAGQYDQAQGFVVRASSARAARELVAQTPRLDHGPGDEGPEPWLRAESRISTLARDVSGPAGVILCDFQNG